MHYTTLDSQHLDPQVSQDVYGELARALSAAFADVLRESIADLPSHNDALAYALGEGHRTRPLACLLACLAVGGDHNDALPLALGIEYIHKASVVRDDVADGDNLRGGRPCVHTRYGEGVALAVSDVLLTAGLEHIGASRCSTPPGDLLLLCSQSLRQMASGQLEDVAPSSAALSTRDRLSVDEQKTGALTELACKLGAIAGGAAAPAVAALSQYGRTVGTAFQILNSVRNIRGFELDRPAATDLSRRRDSLLTARLRERGGPDIRAPAPLNRGRAQPLDSERVDDFREALARDGTLEFAESLAESMLTEARGSLATLPHSAAKTLLADLAERDLLEIYAF